MNRLELIKTIFLKSNFKNYLEIGCYKGKTFFPVSAKKKIAVDPSFHPLFYKELIFTLIKKPNNFRNKYFRETSDDFFNNHKQFLTNLKTIDVVLIDGLHTFETSLNDVINSLNYLNPDGVIVMHDCNPTNPAAALPTKHFPTKEDLVGVEGWTGAWCGDVWKTIAYLNKYHAHELDVYVLNTDNGLGIVRRKSSNNIKPNQFFNLDDYNNINRMVYSELELDREKLLNLKSANYAEDLIKEICN